MVLGNNFVEQVWKTSLGNRNNFEEQLCKAALKSNFEWGTILGRSFRTQLWGAAFGNNFGEQLSGAALENNFGQPFLGSDLQRVAGVVLMALGWLWWRTGLPNDAVDAAAFCVPDVALGNIYLHFIWQAWHLVILTITLRGRCGIDGTGLALGGAPGFQMTPWSSTLLIL
jgi:hypothetical protein